MEGVAHFQCYDEALKIFSEIKSDLKLMCMFSKHRKIRYRCVRDEGDK